MVACCLVTHSQHARWRIGHSFKVIFIIANWRDRFCLDTTIFFTYFSYLLYMFIPYLSIFYLTLPCFCSTDVVHTFLRWMKGCQERTVCWDSWAAGSSQANLMDFFMYQSADSETVVVSVVGLESQEPLL